MQQLVVFRQTELDLRRLFWDKLNDSTYAGSLKRHQT
jgi:hypothetical protein